MSTQAGAQVDSDALNVDDDVIDRDDDSGAPVDDSGTEGDVSQGDDTDDDAPQDVSVREKRYRLALRSAEADRDSLSSQVLALQRAAVEGALTDNRYGLQAKAFWLSGAEVADLVDTDTGLVDAEKVQAAIAEAVDMFGLNRRMMPDPSQGAGSGEYESGGVEGAILRAFGAK